MNSMSKNPVEVEGRPSFTDKIHDDLYSKRSNPQNLVEVVERPSDSNESLSAKRQVYELDEP